MGSRKSQVVGHRYFFGMHMGVGRGPMDEMVAIKVGDRIAWTGSVTANASIQIDQPGLFGGDDKEGGIAGQLDVLMGEPTQAVNARLAAMLGGLVPAFRGVATTFFDGLMCSGSPYPKPWTYRWRRALKGWDGEPWYPAKAVITLAGPAGEPIKAMNPAHILYECFTNADWGRGLARARLDDAAWVAAADKLFAEGFGLCLKWSRQDSIAAFMQGVVDHIGAVQFVDPATGLIVLRLIRDDYVVASLPLFDADSGLLAIDDDDAASQSAGVNEVVVRYRSPVDGKDHQVRVKNPGAIHAMGGVASVSKDYPGLPTAELALRVAQRDLRASTGFIKKFKVRLDRRGYQVLPGSVFRIRDTKRGIAEMVLRAGRVESGPLTVGAITITALQDVFGLPASSYVAVQVGGYVAPVTTPAPLTSGRLIEVSYRDLAAQLGRYDLDNLDASSAYLAAVAGALSGTTLGFQLRSRRDGVGAFAVQAEGAVCAVAQLGAALGVTQNTATVVTGIALTQVAVGSAALLDDEIVRVDSIDLVGGTVTLGRGCVDTVPAPHAAGATLLFYEGTGAVDTHEFSAGINLQCKLLTRTSAGLLSEAAASALSITLGQRQARPYPPANLRINGAPYPATVTAVNLAVSWRHRDRLVQADQLVDNLQLDIGPEAGTTYSWRLLTQPGGALVVSGSAVSGASAAISARPSGSYLLELWSMRGGLESLQRARHAFNWVQTGTYLVRTITLSGPFSAGVDLTVVAGGLTLATYRTTGADANLAGAATSLAAAVNGVAGYTASAAGAVITVTGPLGVSYTLTAIARRAVLGFTLVRAAAYASAGASYVAELFIGNFVTGVASPVAGGKTFTLAVERPIGSVVAVAAYTTGGSESDSTALSGLHTAFTSAFAGLGYGMSLGAAANGVPLLTLSGPFGVADVYARTTASAPYTLAASVRNPGAAAVPSDVPQITAVAVAGSPVVGELYVLTLAGADYNHLVTTGEDGPAVAAALAAAVSAGSLLSATSAGASVEVTGSAATLAFANSGYVVPLFALTVA